LARVVAVEHRPITTPHCEVTHEVAAGPICIGVGRRGVAASQSKEVVAALDVRRHLAIELIGSLGSKFQRGCRKKLGAGGVSTINACSPQRPGGHCSGKACQADKSTISPLSW
jgi:hypothetical protein